MTMIDKALLEYRAPTDTVIGVAQLMAGDRPYRAWCSGELEVPRHVGGRIIQIHPWVNNISPLYLGYIGLAGAVPGLLSNGYDLVDPERLIVSYDLVPVTLAEARRRDQQERNGQ